MNGTSVAAATRRAEYWKRRAERAAQSVRYFRRVCRLQSRELALRGICSTGLLRADKLERAA